MEPDLEALRALVLVAEEQSISAAAGRLGVSQQAVSLRIRGLEKGLHEQLLVRSPRGSRLTPIGVLVVGWATSLLDAADDFTDAIAALAADSQKSLHIAASLTIAEHLLPQWIARWRSRASHDAPVVRLTAANSRAVIAAVREGVVDFGFIETPVVPADLGSTTVGHDTIEVVAHGDHPWARAGRVTSAKLATTPLVLREEGSGTRQALEDALAGGGCSIMAQPAAVISSTLGVRSAIMGGLAPGALSSLAVAADLQAGRLCRIAVPGLEITRKLTAVWVGNKMARPVREFLEAALSG